MSLQQLIFIEEEMQDLRFRSNLSDSERNRYNELSEQAIEIRRELRQQGVDV